MEPRPETMISTLPEHPIVSDESSPEARIEYAIDSLMASLPDPEQLSAEQRRSLIARYTAVLEGNFIYWMTGAYLAAKTEAARSIIAEKLHEEVRDSHPAMLRRFALAAQAMPTESDVMAVHRRLTSVRLFVGRLRGVQLIVMMAFFEGFIQKFMGFLGRLGTRQGSLEQEYTDVHGVCDIAHTRELFRALAAEIAARPAEPDANLFEGVELLRGLIEAIVFGTEAKSQRTQATAVS